MTDLVGIISQLDSIHEERIKRIWQELKTNCGWSGPQHQDIPHFSWHVAEFYDEERLAVALIKMCSSLTPFKVATAGLGIFTAEKPVVYIPLVKDENLLRLHQSLWNNLEVLGLGISPYYAPDRWMPHITLAYHEVDAEVIGCIVNRLAFEPVHWEITIDNLVIVSHPNEVNERPLTRFPFSG